MLFDLGNPRLTKLFFKLYGLAWLALIVWGLLVPPEKPNFEPLSRQSNPPENIWKKKQHEKPRQATIPSAGCYFDDPPEEWHEADEKDDSDDPELYIDKYDGR